MSAHEPTTPRGPAPTGPVDREAPPVRRRILDVRLGTDGFLALVPCDLVEPSELRRQVVEPAVTARAALWGGR